MFTADRCAAVAACVGLGVCLALAGCRQESPAEPNKTRVPKIPAAPADKTPTPAKEPAPAEPEVTAPPATQPAAEAPATAPTLTTVDERDAPDAPPYFPRSRAVGDWEKHKPVQTALPGNVVRLLPPKTIALIRPYQVKQVATCAYRRSKHGGGQQVVEVLLIQTHNPEDAYGIFTVQATGTYAKGTNQITRTETGPEHLTMHVWKGRHYLRLTAPNGSDPELVKACKDLMRKITFLMPDSSPPELVEALPREGLVADQQWLIRSWHSMVGPGAAALNVPRGKQLGEVLGLDKDSQMLIATYRIEGANRPHRIWVVRYESPDQARKAHQAYQALLDEGTDRRSASTMLLPPKGRYLMGTWTAEEESLASVLPKLQDKLE